MRGWFLLILIIFPLISYSQIRDRNWIIGYWGHLATFNIGNINLRNVMRNTQLPSFAEGASCISDENGEIALICNGYFLYDTLGNVIQNGDSLSPSKLLNYDYGFSNWPQQTIILPRIGNQYYVINTTQSDSAFDRTQNNQGFWFDLLLYHTVEAYGGGKGKVLEKSNILMDNAVLSQNRMTAVKHANGRDWWLIKPHQKEHLFYAFLVTPEKIEGPFEQKLDKPIIEFPNDPTRVSVFGSSTFSRDGNYYAYTVAEAKKVFVSRFDRCSGKFYDHFEYNIPTMLDSSQAADYTYGVSFSPNSKLLYVNTRYNIWQIDLVDRSNGSVQFIHGPDTSSFFMGYLYPALAPNGKIYIGNRDNIGRTMSSIDNPNVRGIGCNFCARCLRSDYLSSPPNMPYYALGALEGSSCDTINKYVDVLIVPNAFSPNRDGLNDVWRLANKNVLLYHNITVEECGVYNRWGNRVFTGRGLDFEWDGADYGLDTYHFFIRYKLSDGTTKIEKGEVNLIR